MDINSQLQPIIAGMIDNLKGSIEDELRAQISTEVVNKLAASEFDTAINQAVDQFVKKRINDFNFVNLSDEVLQVQLAQLTEQINRTLTDNANKQITSYVSQKLAAINITDVIGGLVQNKVGSMLQAQSFPDKSIKQTAIDFTGFATTGDNIKGGIIENFGSTGIEDRASFVQLTLMDHASAFEGPLFAPTITVKGVAQFDGKLVLNGDIDTSTAGFDIIVDKTSDAVRTKLNTELFDGFSQTIFNKIQTEGLDLNKITQEGREIIKGTQLGYFITDSNLRKVGILNDLQTSGENLLSDTLYVTQGRVGINSIDPEHVLSVWDQEVEVVVNKHAQDVGYVGTSRRQQLVLGANSKENITLDVDGSVQVNNLVLGKVSMLSADSIPTYVGTRGQIIWNENPDAGRHIGWVCLGNTRWAGFGKIE